MSLLSTELTTRSESKCEICSNTSNLQTYIVPPKTGNSVDEQVALCDVCHGQILDPATADKEHWRILNESIWSVVPAIQVVSYRMLKNLNAEKWAEDLLGMVFLDDETLEWAEADQIGAIIHKDANGAVLNQGDTVVLIKDLDVKGANFTAKRGTAVRRITLVKDNAAQIEGKVNEQHIVILTQFVKKSV